MPRVIIFEGPDRCFKSTSAKMLSNEFLLRGQHMPVYKASNFSQLFTKQVAENGTFFLERLRHASVAEADMIKQLEIDLIFDRHYPSEFVYSRYYNRPTDIKVLNFLDETFAEMGARIILLRRRSYEGWQDNLDQSIDLSRIDNLYDEFLSGTHVSSDIIYVDGLNRQQILQQIVAALRS